MAAFSTKLPFNLARQLSLQAEGAGELTCFCTEPLGARAGDPVDLRLGCGCAIHYHCLVAYLQSKIGDRATMSVRGIACPYGGDCRSHQAEPSPDRSSVYFVTLEDLDNIVDYRTAERAEALDALLQENETEPITHEDVGALRAWLEENDLLQALRKWLGDPSVTQPEMLALARLGEAKEPAFRSLVRQRGVLPQQLAEELRAHLAAVRGKGYKDATDPYVEATTKACPSCGMRSTHWHGHQCHYISPATSGCPNCHVKYCFRCLSTETENARLRGDQGKCLCGYWHNFCKPIRSAADVEQFVRLNQGIAFDSRCGCVICNVCSQGRPCGECPGDCGVCTGLLNPSPIGVGEEAWVALKDGGEGSIQSIDPLQVQLFDACRGGGLRGLNAVDAVLEGAGAAGGEAGAAAVTALVNSQDREGRTCLIVAVDARRVRIVERLSRVPGLDANLGRIDGGLSVIILAAIEGQTEIVQALLAFPGIDANARNNGGYSALIEAAYRGYTEIVQALLAFPGIDINARDNDGYSVIMWAALKGQTEIVQALLVVPGIDVNARNNGGHSALILAAMNGHTEIVQALLAVPGLEVNARDNYGNSALFKAAFEGHTEIVLALLAVPGIDVNARDNYGRSALLFAACEGHTKTVLALLTPWYIRIWWVLALVIAVLAWAWRRWG